LEEGIDEDVLIIKGTEALSHFSSYLYASCCDCPAANSIRTNTQPLDLSSNIL